MNKKSYNLEMQFPVTNTCIKWCRLTCCSWGQIKTYYDKDNQIKGKITQF
jgi:hypothetical protein